MANQQIKEIGKTTQVVITKEVGESLLARRDNERKPTQRHIWAIAKSIKNSGWFGSMLAVSELGELLDGQNRLLALKTLGWPEVSATIREFKEDDVTPELRASFNKSRPQSLRNTMTMSFHWGEDASRRVPVYSYLSRICRGQRVPVDEYTMMGIHETFPETLNVFLKCPHKKGQSLPADVRSAFIMCALADQEKSLELMYSVRDMTFTSTRCHARRIYDLLHSSSAVTKNFGYYAITGGGGETRVCKLIIYAIDKYINGVSCPVLDKLDLDKVERIANPYIDMFKARVTFR